VGAGRPQVLHSFGGTLPRCCIRPGPPPARPVHGDRAMFHIVSHATKNTFLFHSWTEGLVLWQRIVEEVPQLEALVLMPDHVHLLHLTDVRRRLAHALSSYVLHRNAARGQSGAGVDPLPEAMPLPNREHTRRTERYVYLNPVRGHLVPDPLSWPLSTYRDKLGLAAWPIVTVSRDPARLHEYVCSDETVDVRNRAFPSHTLSTDDAVRVLHATSAVTRTPLARLQRRGAARTLFLRAASVLCPKVPRTDIARLVSATRHTAIRAAAERDAATRAVAHAVGDDRFPPLYDVDLRRLPGWRR